MGYLGVFCVRPRGAPEALRSPRLSEGPSSGCRAPQSCRTSYLGALRWLIERGASPLSLQAPCCLTPAIYPRFKLQVGLEAKSQPNASWFPLRRRTKLPASRAWLPKPTGQQASPEATACLLPPRGSSPRRGYTLLQLLYADRCAALLGCQGEGVYCGSHPASLTGFIRGEGSAPSTFEFAWLSSGDLRGHLRK